jgi:hypothetical protein
MLLNNKFPDTFSKSVRFSLILTLLRILSSTPEEGRREKGGGRREEGVDDG